MDIEKILFRQTHGVLSLTGGGGKTSLMFHLARLLAAQGKRVLTTTTTKIFVPTGSQSETVLTDQEPSVILRQAAPLMGRGGHVTAAAAILNDTEKLKGFNPAAIRIFENSGLFDWILVEADGSARRPLKAPAEHEPVVPPNTNVLVAVAGLEVLGQPLSEELVFRAELAAERMGLQMGEIITEIALARLFAHPLGPFKGAPDQAIRFIFLNKADDRARCEGGFRVAALLKQIPRGVADSLIVGQALESIHVHASFSLKGES